jgi:hypothetical protein
MGIRFSKPIQTSLRNHKLPSNKPLDELPRFKEKEMNSPSFINDEKESQHLRHLNSLLKDEQLREKVITVKDTNSNVLYEIVKNRKYLMTMEKEPSSQHGHKLTVEELYEILRSKERKELDEDNIMKQYGIHKEVLNHLFSSVSLPKQKNGLITKETNQDIKGIKD